MMIIGGEGEEEEGEEKEGEEEEEKEGEEGEGEEEFLILMNYYNLASQCLILNFTANAVKRLVIFW